MRSHQYKATCPCGASIEFTEDWHHSAMTVLREFFSTHEGHYPKIGQRADGQPEVAGREFRSGHTDGAHFPDSRNGNAHTQRVRHTQQAAQRRHVQRAVGVGR